MNYLMNIKQIKTSKNNLTYLITMNYKRISTISESKIFNTSIEKLFYFDKNKRIKKTEETGFLYSNSELNIVVHYTYTDNLLTQTNREDFINQTKSKTIIKNRKLDQRGNPIYEELYDENDTLKLKVERIFEYY
jgi:hypothetical protein